MVELYIFDQDDYLLTILTESTGLVSARIREELNRVPDEPFYFTIEADTEKAQYVVEENQVVFRDREGDLRLFVIKEIDDLDNIDGPTMTATCEPAFMELQEHIVVERRIVDQTANVALAAALQDTRWTGSVEVELGNATTNFYYISSVDAIWKILNVWGGEIKDVVTFDEQNNITARQIKIIQRLGADNGLRFEIDHNTTEIGRTVLSYPQTALYGRGASSPVEGENMGGYTRYIDFADVEWRVSRGDPVDKPRGQRWVGDPGALLKYGRKHDGELLHRFGIWQNQDIEDPAELLRATWEQLQTVQKPEVNYRLSVNIFDDQVSLGDTARAIDRQFARPIEIQARVVAIEYDLLDVEGTTVVEMGQLLNLDDDRLDQVIEDINHNRGKWGADSGPITDDRFPDAIPPVPSNVDVSGNFRAIMLSWDYHSESWIAAYEVYASQVRGFVPDPSSLVFRGNTSGFTFKADEDQIWYFRLRTVNRHGRPSAFTEEYSASTVRIITDDILFGSIIAEHLQDNLDIAEKLAQSTIDRINQRPMEAIQYTQEQIEATETAILDELNTRIGDVNTSIDDLLSRTEGLEGTVTDITQEVDDIEGRLSTTIRQLSNLDGVVSEHTTTLQQHGELISAKAERSEVYTRTDVDEKLGEKVDATVYSNKMAQLDLSIEGITQRVTNTETEIDTVSGNVNTALSQIAELDIRADGISQSVSEIRADFDALEIGGRNLLKDSGRKISSGSYAAANYDFTEPMIEGEIYTCSIMLKITNKTQRFALYNSGGTNALVGWRSIPSDKQEVMALFTVTFTGKVVGTNTFLRVYTGVNGESGTTEIEWIKLERGNRATDWTPAPEDTDARITSAETRIDQNARQIELKANQTSVDSLTDRMSQAESRISVMSDEIDLKVNRDGVIAGINITPETVRIHGNRIHLTGQTLIDDGIIGTAAIANAAITRAKLGTAVVGTAQIENGAITNLKVANGAIDTAHITNLAVTDAKIVSISGHKIDANSIRTDRLMVGNFDNIIDNPNFLSTLEPHVANMGQWVLSTSDSVVGTTSVRSNGSTGEHRLYLGGNHVLQVQPGDRYYFSIWARRVGSRPHNRVNLSIRCITQDGEYLTFAGSTTWNDSQIGTSWVKLEITATMPAGAVYAAPTIRIMDDGNNTNYLFDGAYVRRMIGTAIIDDLSASKITSGTINAANVLVRTQTGSNAVQLDGDGFKTIDSQGRTRIIINVRSWSGNQADPAFIRFLDTRGTVVGAMGSNVNNHFAVGGPGSFTLDVVQNAIYNAQQHRFVAGGVTRPNDYIQFSSILNTSGTFREPYIRTPFDNDGYIGSASFRWWRIYTHHLHYNQLNQISTRDQKTDIEKASIEELSHAFDQITLKKYRYKVNDGVSRDVSIGVIAEEAPAEILNESGESLNFGNYISVVAGALKVQKQRIGGLEDEINWLKIRNQYLKQKIQQLEEMLT